MNHNTIAGFTLKDIFKMFLQNGIKFGAIGPALLHTISRTSKQMYAVCAPVLTRMRATRTKMLPRVAEAYRRKLLATVPYTRSAVRCYQLDELALSPRGGVVLQSDPPFMPTCVLGLRRIHLLLRELTPLHAYVQLTGWGPLAYTYNDTFADAGAHEGDHNDNRGRYLATLPMSTDYNPVLLGNTAYLPACEHVELFASHRELINGGNCIPDPEYMIANVSHVIVEYLVMSECNLDEYEFVRAHTQRCGMLYPFIRKIKNTAADLLG